MTKIAIVAGLCLTVACTGVRNTHTSASLTPQHASAIRDSLVTTLDAFRRHSATGQWDSLLTYYSSDSGFRWVENGAVVARSSAGIATYLRSMPAGARIETNYTNPAILPVAPGVASVLTDFDTKVTIGTGGFAFSGSLTMLFRHEAGRWRIVAGHSSSPRPRQ